MRRRLAPAQPRIELNRIVSLAEASRLSSLSVDTLRNRSLKDCEAYLLNEPDARRSRAHAEQFY
jgi:hypothetical protein